MNYSFSKVTMAIRCARAVNVFAADERLSVPVPNRAEFYKYFGIFENMAEDESKRNNIKRELEYCVIPEQSRAAVTCPNDITIW